MKLMTVASYLAIVLACAPFGALQITSAQDGHWPIVESLQKTHVFAIAGDDDSPFRTLIRDTSGRSVYSMTCHTGDYEGRGEANFSGDFQCVLEALSANARASGNLLAAKSKNEQSAAWWNRGRMRAAQLRGECLAFPEYSTVRHFKLRGMQITMTFADIEWSAQRDAQGNPRIGRFKFLINIRSDNSANTDTAEPAVGAPPPARCYP